MPAAVVRPGASVRVEELLANPSVVWDLMPTDPAPVTRADAAYHASVRERWIESNQLITLRNLHFHRQAAERLSRNLPDGAVVLELGAGVGFDAVLALEACPKLGAYLLSEIACDLVDYARRSNPTLISDPRVIACCLDGGDLLLQDAQVDRILMVGALHHLPDLAKALDEMDRVARPGARLVFAIEPNRRWLAVIASMRPIYRRLFERRAVSPADEKAEGFVPSEFEEMASRRGWVLEEIVPVWFLAGFAHYGVEVLHRLLRSERWFALPHGVERLILALDSLLFRIPGVNQLAWHYTAVFSKP